MPDNIYSLSSPLYLHFRDSKHKVGVTLKFPKTPLFSFNVPLSKDKNNNSLKVAIARHFSSIVNLISKIIFLVELPTAMTPVSVDVKLFCFYISLVRS